MEISCYLQIFLEIFLLEESILKRKKGKRTGVGESKKIAKFDSYTKSLRRKGKIFEN